MRTLLGTLAAVAGFGFLIAAPASAASIPVTPKSAIAELGTSVEQVHRRHRHHHRHYRSYGFYQPYYQPYYRPRYRSYGYYGGGFPGFNLYIGPRHRFGHHRRWW